MCIVSLLQTIVSVRKLPKNYVVCMCQCITKIHDLFALDESRDSNN